MGAVTEARCRPWDRVSWPPPSSTADITDDGDGLVTHFKMPGDFTAQLFQPRYTKNG